MKNLDADNQDLEAEDIMAARIYLGVGSNIDAQANIAKALNLLALEFGQLEISPIYENPAEGFAGDNFLNLVVALSYSGSITSILEIFSRIEQQCGRVREHEEGMGNRSMDLDLLTFHDLTGEYEGVNLPRKDVYTRKFVWHPLRALINIVAEPTDFELGLVKAIDAIADID